jgi:hypothetical protein
VADHRPPVIERVDATKVRDLKHVRGTTYRRFWFPYGGSATYSFRYPYGNRLNSYNLHLSYNWTIKPGWVLREPQGLRIVGPKPD